ncbi:hypothetical protein TraAM80_10333 [Trypanosoma rangeli]|uniref:Uncharacterized protein n=1 Tax=Trypanosoma rangeli TaxID=5698 RepID=A0A3R7JTJ2_TRYRA|nr:uncharacterized protein TraAM80_10333 [Trypanosoma rangeli]RNE95230.1 hypothetical protein TraAM80_10333 [Trypanosoma rangeli]|eukprot:RNE95230.1 hypothetical protein TraAM80_10333 [Trypanosoma rangeli]
MEAFLLRIKHHAAHDSITDYLRKVGDIANKQVFTYMGGDAYNSCYWEENPDKVCVPADSKTLLNCIFEWTRGAFADTKRKYHGVPFFRGALHSIPGTGRLNGYTDYWREGYPAHGRIYLISRLDLTEEGATATWYDGTENAKDNHDTPREAFGIVCEVQDGIIEVTTLPEVVPWVQDNWYVILIAGLALLALIALIVIVCCCCRRTSDESTGTASMELQEVSRNAVYGIPQRRRGGSGFSENPDVFMRPPHAQPYVVQRNCWMSPSQRAAPFEVSAAPTTRSRRFPVAEAVRKP